MNLDTLIEAKRVGEEVIPVVDLRGLHKLLEVKRKFADWAKDKVKYYKEGEHYVVLSFSTPSLDKNGKKRASTSKEYYVSLEIAKSVVKDRPALVEFFEARLPPQEPPPFDIKALHKLLGVGTRLNEWVSRRIKERGFEEGIHYHKQNNTYTFSEKALKELLLSERCEKSREALKAFLDREEKQTAALQSIENITLDLSKTLVHFNGEDIYLSSLDIASTTGKMHKNVIRDIEEEKAKLGSVLADMRDRLRSEPISENLEKLEALQEMLNGFKEDSYVDSNGRRQKAYNLTEGAATQILLRYSPEARAYFIYQFKKMHQTIINMFKVKVAEQVLPEIKGEQKYLYIIRNEDSGNIKLGISSDPHDRLKQLQTGNDSELRLVYSSYVCTNAREIEKAMHEYFQDSHIRGEWFSVSVEEAIRYMNNVVYRLNSKMPSLEHI